MYEGNPYHEANEEIVALKATLRERIEMGHVFESFVVHAGWQHMVRKLTEARIVLVNALINPKVANVGYLQGQIRTIDRVLELPQAHMDAGREAERTTAEGT